MIEYASPNRIYEGRRDELLKDDRWIFEEKFNGKRCFVVIRDSKIHLYSRHNSVFESYKYRHLIGAIRKYDLPNIILDSELWESKLRIWSVLPVNFESNSYQQTRTWLEDRVFNTEEAQLVSICRGEEEKSELTEKVLPDSTKEGIVAKRIDKPYPVGKTYYWLKWRKPTKGSA